MSFENITIGQIITFITCVGIICGFFYKTFALFNDIKETKKLAKDAHTRIDKIKVEHELEKNEILEKVEETNTAVNLLCHAVSALIDCELSDKTNVDELKRVKQQLDDKRELI